MIREERYDIAAICESVFIQNALPAYEANRIKKSRSILETDRNRIIHSLSYKLGYGLTYLPRKARALLKYSNIESLKHIASHSPLINSLIHFRKEILSAYGIYRKMIVEYGKRKTLISAGGTGDVYISNGFINAYIHDNSIEDGCLYLIPGESCYATTKLFKFDHTCKISKISKEEWLFLLHLYRFSGREADIDLLYYHIHTVYTQFTETLEGLHGWNLFSLMHQINFCNQDKDCFELPRFNISDESVNLLLKRYGLKRGKTVILSPYAKCPPNINDNFWQYLCDRMKKNGYCVCTNSASAEETPIDGSIPVFFPYDIAVPFVEACGYIVGLRSGFLDIIETANAKKVALYPFNCAKRGLSGGGATASFSVNAMFGRNDFLELETGLSNLKEVADDIIDYFNDERCVNENDAIYAY
ncbi:MAG: hypothetical protein IJS12_08780 [Lachnospiraceae bacterium]|nr:hypothetical protein [Lachnospiraceae bacterium]